MPGPVLVSWSGGKDCCMALHALRAEGHDVAGLLTTIRQEDATVGMHGIPRDLIARQAAALGLPVTFVEVPAGASNAVYGRALASGLAPIADAGTRTVAFGD